MCIPATKKQRAPKRRNLAHPREDQIASPPAAGSVPLVVTSHALSTTGSPFLSPTDVLQPSTTIAGLPIDGTFAQDVVPPSSSPYGLDDFTAITDPFNLRGGGPQDAALGWKAVSPDDYLDPNTVAGGSIYFADNVPVETQEAEMAANGMWFMPNVGQGCDQQPYY
ncbi:hypothetical protein C8Q79DRAFT_929864 [Trametes meyenii]|nr:hypothetical protein C8Q79DRAFT_929864 [Trametes meyenii]